MTKLIKRLICALGIHRYKFVEMIPGPKCHFKCRWCRKDKVEPW